jgi:hypothetical protein
MEKAVILYDHLEYFATFGIIYGLVVYVVCGHLVYFSGLVCSDKEESGNLCHVHMGELL